jgi:hypothetical protein
MVSMKNLLFEPSWGITFESRSTHSERLERAARGKILHMRGVVRAHEHFARASSFTFNAIAGRRLPSGELHLHNASYRSLH